MTTTVIIDDTDSSISYSDGWTLAGVSSARSSEYNSTVHIGSSNGLELTFSFSGNRVCAYGTLVSPLVNGVATSTYTIDNFTVGSTVFTGGNLATIPDLQSHLLLYESPTLQEGSHNLTISISNITNGSPGYYLDFFTVDTFAPNTKSQIIVDDSNPEIKYIGNWTDSHAFNEYLSTDHKASSLGDSNATFAFNGTALSVFGSIATSNDPATQIDFYIDSNPVVHYIAPQPGNILRNTPLFSQSGLSPGPHTLLLVSKPSSQWWLDYLIYSTEEGTTASAPANGSGPSGNSSPPVGAIVGGVVGGIALIACAITFWFLRRRRSIKQSAIPSAAVVSENERFPISATEATNTPREKAFPPGTPISGASQNGQLRDSAARSATVPAAAASAVSSQGSRPHAEEPHREVDGGVRLVSGDEDDDDPPPALLPPSYARY